MRCSLLFNHSRFGFATMILIMGVALTGHAITKPEYAAALRAALDMVIEVENRLASIRFENTIEEIPGDLAAEVRSLVPTSLQVETPGGSVEVANEWLYQRLAEFDREQDLNEKAVILAEVRERLSALAAAVSDEVAETRSKDEEKRKLAEILAREDYQRPAAPEESSLEKWLASLLEWFSGLFPSGQNADSSMPVLGPAAWVLRLIIVGALAIILGFGIYKLIPLLFPNFSRRTEKSPGERLILGETIGADQHAASLFEDAERAAREGDLRGAIRKGYIAALCELSDRGLIGLARHKTNRDYLRAVRDRETLFQDLQGMTESFERHWYGRENGDLEIWNSFRDSYRKAVSEAGKAL